MEAAENVQKRLKEKKNRKLRISFASSVKIKVKGQGWESATSMGLVALHLSVDTAAAWQSGTALEQLIFALLVIQTTTTDKMVLKPVWEWKGALSKAAMHLMVMSSL